MSLGWGAQFVRTRVRPEDIPKTAIITPFGLFEFLRMLFGLKNTAQTFQRLMDFVLRDWDFLFVYLNDKVVSKKINLPYTSFEHPSQHGLIPNSTMCQFGLSTIDFLSHEINKDRVVLCHQRWQQSVIPLYHAHPRPNKSTFLPPICFVSRHCT